MAILHSDLETDLRMAAALDDSLHVTLTDMASVRRTGAITFLGSVNGTLSDTAGIRYASLGGSDHFANSAAEATDTAETAVTDTSVNIAVVRSVLNRKISDIATATGSASDINPASLAADMGFSFEGYFNGLVATAIATASTDVGQAAIDMSVDDFYDALIQLESGDNPTPYFAMLHSRQMADFRTSLRAEGGAVQFNAATQQMISAFGQGVAGEFMGVTFFKSSDVSSAGGSRHGAMWSQGALGWKSLNPDPRNFYGAGTVVSSSIPEVGLVVEITRNASTALTEVVGNAYVGLGVLEQARLVGIVTDA